MDKREISEEYAKIAEKVIKEENNGIYIGEMNSIGFKYGRGVFINNYTKMYYRKKPSRYLEFL